MSESRNIEDELRQRAEYQTLVAEISSSLLRADPERMDSPIEAALARVGERYGVDYCGFWWLESGGRWVQPHVWSREHGTITWPDDYPVQDVPWASELIRAGGTISVETPEDFPPQAAAYRAMIEGQGLVSMLATPLDFEGEVVGVFMLSTRQEARR